MLSLSPGTLMRRLRWACRWKILRLVKTSLLNSVSDLLEWFGLTDEVVNWVYQMITRTSMNTRPINSAWIKKKDHWFMLYRSSMDWSYHNNYNIKLYGLFNFRLAVFPSLKPDYPGFNISVFPACTLINLKKKNTVTCCAWACF